jgi:hypothetical protein
LPLAQSRPSLVAIAAAMGRILDGRPVSPKAAAARQLAMVLDRLHKGSGQRRGSLKLVRAMTDKGGA